MRRPACRHRLGRSSTQFLSFVPAARDRRLCAGHTLDSGRLLPTQIILIWMVAQRLECASGCAMQVVSARAAEALPGGSGGSPDAKWPAACDDRLVRPTVVIVDDHAGFRSSARALLEAEGFDVVGEAGDGVSALVAVGRLHPHVVLLDIQLPDIDGFEVADRLALAGHPPGRCRPTGGGWPGALPGGLSRRASCRGMRWPRWSREGITGSAPRPRKAVWLTGLAFGLGAEWLARSGQSLPGAGAD